MKKINSVIIGIIVISIIIFAGIIFAALKNKPSRITQYNATDQEKPKIQISEINFDFGKIKVKDIATKDIQIKNIGQKNLELQNFSTSCDCTFVQIITEKEKSPKFSMHQNPSWQAKIGPQKAVTLKIFYEPARMPVKGKVQRAIFFQTNDPEKSKITVSFTAEVE